MEIERKGEVINEILSPVFIEIMEIFKKLGKNRKSLFFTVYHNLNVSISKDFEDHGNLFENQNEHYVGEVLKTGDVPNDQTLKLVLEHFSEFSNKEICDFMDRELKKLYNDEIIFNITTGKDRKLFYKLLEEIKRLRE
jgi:hypothetical protein